MKLTTLFLLGISLSCFGQNNSAEKWNNLSEENFRLNDQKSLEYALKAKKHALKKNNLFELGRSQINIGNVYINLNKIDLSIYELRNSISIFQKLENDTMLGRSHLILGDALVWNTDYRQGTEELFKALRCFQKKPKDKWLAKVYNSLGIAYDESKNSEKAIHYYQKSLRYALNIGDSKTEGITHMNIGIILMNDSCNTEARANYDRALKIFDSINFESGKTVVLNNIAINYRRLKQYGHSINLYKKILEHYKEKKDSVLIARTLLNLASVHRDKKQYKKAESLFLHSLSISKKINYRRNLVLCYGKLALNYRDLNDFQNAYKYNLFEFNLTKKIYSSKKENQILELNEKYQTEQKENQILKLSSSNNAQKAKTANFKLLSFGIAGLLLILLIGGIWLAKSRKQKHLLAIQKQKTEALESTISASDTEKERIGKELHDGVASELISFYYEIENAQPELSHKVLTAYEKVRKVSHELDNTPRHGTIILDRLSSLIPENSEDEFDLSIEPISLELSEPLGTHLYRIIQELIINSLKYAEASKTVIYITQEIEYLSIQYQDNGKGTESFNVGNGHKNIQDRLTLLKGTGTVETSHANGFTMKIHIPTT